jgi:hypothetical protein
MRIAVGVVVVVLTVVEIPVAIERVVDVMAVVVVVEIMGDPIVVRVLPGRKNVDMVVATEIEIEIAIVKETEVIALSKRILTIQTATMQAIPSRILLQRLAIATTKPMPLTIIIITVIAILMQQMRSEIEVDLRVVAAILVIARVMN